MHDQVIFVDVDDTLVRSVGTKRIPMPGVVEQVHLLKEQGCILYLWSSGGAAYCEETAKKLKLTDCFVGYLPKPHIYIDDQTVNEWRFCRHLYPSQAENACQ